MNVLLVRPGETPREMEIDGTLESMQKLVGGYIECAYYFPEVILVCNDEGLINGMPFNRVVWRDGQAMAAIHGPFFLCESDGEKFASISKKNARKYAEMFLHPEVLTKSGTHLFAQKLPLTNNPGSLDLID